MMEESGLTKELYPGVSDRVKAALADSCVVLVLSLVTMYVLSLLGEVPDSARIIAFVLIFVLYDPLLTAFAAGTLGHRMNGLRVKQDNDHSRNVNFLLAIFRSIVKFGLGWISLLMVSGNEKRKAMHDWVSGSVVLYAKNVKKRSF